jgi:hypothetical protein
LPRLVTLAQFSDFCGDLLDGVSLERHVHGLL